jgi:Spirocyclase AveC-like
METPMATTLPSSQPSEGDGPAAVTANPDGGVNFNQKWPAPILWWSAVGGLIVVLQAYVWVRWFASGEARPVSTGIDTMPDGVKATAWVLQIAIPVTAVGVLVWLVHRCVRERRLVLDAIILIGWISLYWQDPLTNYLRPLVFFNSYYVNLGGWVNGIPGWVSPNGQYTAEPLLVTGAFFLSTSILATIFACVLMDRAKQRWPSSGPIRLIAVAYITTLLVMIGSELIFVRAQVYAFGGVIRALSLWPGTVYQFPLYEPFFVAALLTLVAAMRYFRNADGVMPYERGLQRLNISDRLRTAVRVLAIIGFINVVGLLAHVPLNIIGLHVSTYPAEYPSYLRNDVCGGNSGYECPGNGNPIPLRDTPKTPAPTAK